MNGQRVITSILLVSLLMLCASPFAPGRIAPPLVPIDVLRSTDPVTMSPSKGAGEGPAEATTLPEGVSANWWTTVQKDIRQSEYRVTWQDHTYLPDVGASYHAANRAHNLRTYFSPEGPVVIPRVWTPIQVPKRGAVHSVGLMKTS